MSAMTKDVFSRLVQRRMSYPTPQPIGTVLGKDAAKRITKVFGRGRSTVLGSSESLGGGPMGEDAVRRASKVMGA